MPLYITTGLDDTPEVRYASLLVDHYIAGAQYARLADGTPADTDLHDLLTSAVAAQVKYWEDSGIDPTRMDSSSRVVAKKSLGPASVSYADSDTIMAQRDNAAHGLAPMVRLMLSGLVTHANGY